MKKRKKIGEKGFLLALAAAVLLQTSVTAGASGLKDAQKEKEALENSLKEAQVLIDRLKGSKEDIQGKVTELDGKLTQISGKITVLEEELETKNTEISETKKELKTAQKDEKEQYENMKRRIRVMYENTRKASYIEQLFSAESFSQFLNSVKYIKEITSYDREMLKRYKETQATVENAKTSLEEERAELSQMQEKVKEEKKAVQMLLSAKETELQTVASDLSDASSQADAVAAEIQAQNEIIEQIKQAEAAKKAAREAKAKAEAEARARAEAEAKAKAEAEAKAAEENGTEMPSEAETETEKETENVTEIPEDDSYNGGAFSWPCPSSRRVTSDYGNRISPTAGASSNHKGIDIGASFGADITAAADGTVIFAGYSNGAGNYVMINHGGSLYTVYMHASSLTVSNGMKVSRGQVVAKVGSTGISTGNHLHFGVSLNGNYVSPWDYLGR